MNRSQKSFNQSLFPLIKTKNDTQMSRRDNGELELNVIQFDPFENRCRMKMIIKHFEDTSQKHLTRDTEVQKKFWQFSFHQSKKTVQKDIPVALSTIPNFQINRFEKLEKIMNENNKSAPQSCLSISAHQVNCNKKIELMSFFYE